MLGMSKSVAERGRFELPKPVKVQQFSRLLCIQPLCHLSRSLDDQFTIPVKISPPK